MTPGTGASHTGFQSRAANRVPSDIGIHRCSISSMGSGKEVSSRITVLTVFDLKYQGFYTVVVNRHRFVVILSGREDLHDIVAITVLAVTIRQSLTLSDSQLNDGARIALFQRGDFGHGRHAVDDAVRKAPMHPFGGRSKVPLARTVA